MTINIFENKKYIVKKIILIIISKFNFVLFKKMIYNIKELKLLFLQ